MKIVKLWDKKSTINGVILQPEGWMINNDVILIEENDVVTNIENPTILKNILLNENKITQEEVAELTSIQIGEKYIEYLEEVNNKQKEEVINIKEIKETQDIILLALADLYESSNSDI